MVGEGWKTGSLSAEIVVRIVEQASYELDGPPLRVCSAEVPVSTWMPRLWGDLSAAGGAGRVRPPEADYAKLRSLDNLIDYLGARVAL